MFDSLAERIPRAGHPAPGPLVLGLLIVFRFLATVPVPGIDQTQLNNVPRGQRRCSACSTCSRAAGCRSFSVVALGMNPYINASIIMQLMQGVVPSLQALSREGEYGRNKINQYTRYLTVPMAMLQAYGFLALLNAQQRPDRHVRPRQLRDPDPDRHADRRLHRADVDR